MKASFKAKYDADKATAASAVTLAFNAGDVKLRASMTDATVVNGPSLNGLALAVEKPGSFVIDYNVPKKDFKFIFMNTIRISDKPLNMVYSHSRGDQRTMLDGTLVIDSANKVSANHVLGSGNCKLRYTYVHGGVTTFEPSYDLAKDSWDFAVSRKVYADHVLKAVYQTSNQNLQLDWFARSKMIGSYKSE
ncbi:hypothetical protein OSB04_005199 [Centaurea solstitialis]|uniref:Outer envelope pore protein 24 n=1 Tax=Centaurea solstitialis TaxID=347529 RepID=A0AA38TFJ2_9ASTR|nr:hypothetical protein OSB04_005199 [Centaurea solstitialis]